MADTALDKAVQAMFSDIDLDAAEKTLKELHLPLAYSNEAVDRINREADKLADQAAKLKRAEAPRSERLAIRQQVDRLVNARAFLYRLRPAQPGDVTTTIAPVGGNG
jgi:hypothetical protein